MANLIYGANYTIAKEVMPAYIEPSGFVLLRVWGALIFFAILKNILLREKVQKEDWPKLILCAMFGVVINQLMFLNGLSMTYPINAALLMITTPIFVLVISAIFGSEGLTKRKLVGTALGFSGALIVIGGGGGFSFDADHVVGDAFIVINAISYGCYLVLVKPLMKKYNPLTIITWIFVFGFFPVTIIGWNQFTAIEWSSFTTGIWVGVIYVVLMVTCLAYLFNIIALKNTNPSTVGAYIYLQPILASLVALSFGKDELTMIKMVAAVLIFGGVYLISFQRPTETAKAS